MYVCTMPFKPFVSAPFTTLSETSVIAAKRAFELAVLTYIRSNIYINPQEIIVDPESFRCSQFSQDHQGTALFHLISYFCL
jgi:hypothetical protein